jgi:hypothetical protein
VVASESLHRRATRHRRDHDTPTVTSFTLRVWVLADDPNAPETLGRQAATFRVAVVYVDA